MDSRYKAIKHIGEGAFSSVILALNVETGEKVAIKKMKKRRWKDTAAQAEINALQKLHHDNVVQLLDVFREDYRSFLVFECMDCDLNELVNSRKGRKIPDTVILDITYQVLNGLDFIHANELFHRDIKPENVLIRRRITPAPTPDSNSTIVVEAKIADFGLVHDLDFSRPLTDYISTRWYRAPEVLLTCANYSTPIDVWAVGTIIAELAMLHPLFPGSNQIDQLRRIFEVLGTPRISAPTAADDQAVPGDSSASGSWYEGAVHARKLGIAFIPSSRKPLNTVMRDVSDALVRLVDYILVLNPNDRPTAKDALLLVSHMLDDMLGQQQQQQQPNEVTPSQLSSRLLQPQQELQSHLDAGSRTASETATPTAAAAVVPSRPNLEKDLPNPLASSAGGLLTTHSSPHDTASSTPPSSDSPVVGVTASTDKHSSIDSHGSGHYNIPGSPLPLPPPVQPSIHDGRISFTSQDHFISGAGCNPVAAEESKLNIAALSPVVTSRPSVEVSIVKKFHKEPIIDPGADLSSLAPSTHPSIDTSAYSDGPRSTLQRRRTKSSSNNAAAAADCIVPLMRVSTPVSTSVPAPRMVPRSGINSQSFGEVGIDRAVNLVQRISTTFGISMNGNPPARHGSMPKMAAESTHGFEEGRLSNDFSFSLSDPRMSEDIYHRESSDSHWSGEAPPMLQRPQQQQQQHGMSNLSDLRSGMERVRPHSISSVSSIESMNTRSIVFSPSSSQLQNNSPCSAGFSLSDLPSPQQQNHDHQQQEDGQKSWQNAGLYEKGTGLYPAAAAAGTTVAAPADNRPAIGPSSLLNALVQEELQKQEQQMNTAAAPEIPDRSTSLVVLTNFVPPHQQQQHAEEPRCDGGEPPSDALAAPSLPLDNPDRQSGIISFVNARVSQACTAPVLVDIPQHQPSKVSEPQKKAASGRALPQRLNIEPYSFVPLKSGPASPALPRPKASMPSPGLRKLVVKASNNSSNGGSSSSAADGVLGSMPTIKSGEGLEVPQQHHSSDEQGSPTSASRHGRLHGLRSKANLGSASPLIRRALSIKKKGSKESKGSDDLWDRKDANAALPPLPSMAPNDTPAPRLESIEISPLPIVAQSITNLESGILGAVSIDPSAAAGQERDIGEATGSDAYAEVSTPLAVPETALLQSSAVDQAEFTHMEPSLDVQAATSKNLGVAGEGDASGDGNGGGNAGPTSAKKEWIANMQLLRQRLADSNISGTDRTRDAVHSPDMLARKRRSTGSEMRMALPMRDFLILKSSHRHQHSGKPRVAASKRSSQTTTRSRQSVLVASPSGGRRLYNDGFGSHAKDESSEEDSAGSAEQSKSRGGKEFIQAMASRRAREAEIAQKSIRSTMSSMRFDITRFDADTSDTLDYMGLKTTLHQMLQPPLQKQQKQQEQAGSNSVADAKKGSESLARQDGLGGNELIANLDSFAPVTFDAGSLFRKSIYERNASDSPPSADNATFTDHHQHGTHYESGNDGSALRNKYSRRDLATDHASGHGFLSKVKHAFVGSRNAGNHQPYQQHQYRQQQQQQPLANGNAGSPSPPLANAAAHLPKFSAISETSLPRLDFDLGMTLLTPDSLHKASVDSNSPPPPVPRKSIESKVNRRIIAQKHQHTRAADTAVRRPHAEGSNDSQDYLIDYINSSSSRLPRPSNGGGPGVILSSTPSIQRHLAARRVINESTQARQTQYEYNFGSQIFDCFDSDFMLLKTDAFNAHDVEAARNKIKEKPKQHAGGSDDDDQYRKYGEYRKYGGSHQQHQAAGASKSRHSRKKKPDNITAATAYTAAAINSIVAGNARARGELSPANGGHHEQQQYSQRLII